jgi:hypothetical protein
MPTGLFDRRSRPVPMAKHTVSSLTKPLLAYNMARDCDPRRARPHQVDVGSNGDAYLSAGRRGQVRETQLRRQKLSARGPRDLFQVGIACDMVLLTCLARRAEA